MNRRHNRTDKGPGGRNERGALTIFTGILLLILMTLMTLYATRVGLFESRVSANDTRQKIAFAAAESAADQGIMYILANSARALSSRLDAFPDGAGGTTGDGWLATGVERWATCASAASSTIDPHPCDDIAVGGASGVTGNVYYYDTDGDANTLESMLPVDGLAADSTARLTGLLCFVDLSAGPLAVPTPCGAAPSDVEGELEASLVIWLLGYGYSDCTDTTNPDTCTGFANVALPVSNNRNLSGSPAVPWTTKAVWPPSGTATIAGNPNAGGIGVSATVWANCREFDPCVEYGPGTGTWQTCELQEWYGVDERPPGVMCTEPSCDCGPVEEHLSDPDGGSLDIIEDPAFPDDLFEIYFGEPRENFQVIKNQAEPLDDCDGLDSSSHGFYWIDSDCAFNGNQQVGSPSSPVVLVMSGPVVRFNGTVDFFGVMYFFDYENPTMTIQGNGTFRLYGAGVADIGAGCAPDDNNCGMKLFNGNFHIVYNDEVLASAAGIAGLGGVNGGWRDFGLPEIAW